MIYGERDGHGRYGILDIDDEDLLICHECGRGCRQLATHVRLAHGIETAAEYRERHGLGRRHRLVAVETSQRMSEKWEADRDVRQARLAAARRPAAATKASLTVRPMRPGAIAGRISAAKARRVDLTADQLRRLGDWMDIVAWASRAHQMIRDEGVAVHAIARAYDVSQGAVQGRLRRYPAKQGTRPVSRCGTDAGYVAHYRVGERPCDACWEAHRERSRTDPRRRARGRAKSRARSRLAQIHHTDYLNFVDEMRGEPGLTWNQIRGRAVNRLAGLHPEDLAKLLSVEIEQAYRELE